MQNLSKNNNDPMTTPKLHQFQEIHKTTILEENETMRGSIDRYPGSKLSMHPGGSQSNVKKYNRVDQRRGGAPLNTQGHSSAAGARKANSKNVRTKSSVGGGATSTITEQASITANS